MLIENVMYFALGALVAGLLALIILPAVWKRAVRLTKRRIEAATPITMAEFRADKDQLRAEFALSTRRLEMTVETLRKRLAEQLGEFNQKRSDFGALSAERDTHAGIVKELEAREAALRARVLELERDNTDIAQRLRKRDRELEELERELYKLRASLPPVFEERDDSAEAEALVTAKARIAGAESRLNALLAQTDQVVGMQAGRTGQLLADKLSADEALETLRRKVQHVEGSILANWDTDRLDEAHLREKLDDIAASVSRLVYAAEPDTAAVSQDEISLFDRVQRFADDRDSFNNVPVKPAQGERSGAVSDRMAALREIRGH